MEVVLLEHRNQPHVVSPLHVLQYLLSVLDELENTNPRCEREWHKDLELYIVDFDSRQTKFIDKVKCKKCSHNSKLSGH